MRAESATSELFSPRPQPAPLLLALLLLAAAAGCAAPVRELAQHGNRIGHQLLLSSRDPQWLRAPHGVEAHRINGPLVYVIPVAQGVVLVDTGFEQSGATLREILGARKLLAVLVTHIHFDHVSAAEDIEATVYAGAREAARWRADAGSRALMVRVGERLVPRIGRPKNISSVAPGASVTIGGERFTAWPVPGHTPGSTAWLWRDILFSGDGLVSIDGKTVRPAIAPYNDRPRQGWRSARRMLGVEFSFICDGHYGCTPDARAKLAAALRDAE